MAVERLDPDQVHILGGEDQDIAGFIERDFKIRQGLCPNGCGLMHFDGTFQHCHKCRFMCNTEPELAPQ